MPIYQQWLSDDYCPVSQSKNLTGDNTFTAQPHNRGITLKKALFAVCCGRKSRICVFNFSLAECGPHASHKLYVDPWLNFLAEAHLAAVTKLL